MIAVNSSAQTVRASIKFPGVGPVETVFENRQADREETFEPYRKHVYRQRGKTQSMQSSH